MPSEVIPVRNNPSITLAKALKIKNRLAGRLSKITLDISNYNSVLADRKDQINIPDLISQRQKLVDALTALKIAVYIGNRNIQPQLVQLGEIKSEIQLYNMLPTQDGNVKHDYQGTDIVYFAHIKKNDVDTKVKALESQVDAIQDEIDTYNHTYKIDVPAQVIALAS